MESERYTLKIHERAGLRVISALNSAIFRSCRVTVRGHRYRQEAREKGVPIVYAAWHGHQFPLFPLLARQDVGVIVSRSRDGELVSSIMEGWGYKTFRGSSSRGAVAGLIGLIQHVKRGHDGTITVDGPKGPIHTPKHGIFSLCRKSGAQLIPMAVKGAHFWRLNSWDRYIIPRPFTSYTALFGTPLSLSDDDEENSIRLKAALFELAPEG